MKVGIIFGAFDLCHAGHLLAFRQAKLHCDELIVGLHYDPSTERPDKNSPVETMHERFIRLNYNPDIDSIIPYSHEKDIEVMLRAYEIDIRFLGDDYINKPFTGEEICKEKGIEIFYLRRYPEYSSSALRERIKNADA